MLSDQSYTTKSDVWSFGIVLWEIFSYGDEPYPNYESNEDVMLGILGHKTRLTQPSQCPNNIFSIMMICWNEDPRQRPTFTHIFKQLHVIEKQVNPELSLDYSDVDLNDNVDISEPRDASLSSSSYYNNNPAPVRQRSGEHSFYETY